MFELVKDTKIDFASKFSVTSVISVVLVVAALAITIKGLTWGVDFRGGAELQVKFGSGVDQAAIRSSLTAGGHKGASVTTIGEAEENEYLIKVKASEADLNQVTEEVSQLLKKDFTNSGMNIRKVDIVGPKAGQALRISGFQSMFWALLAIMIYIGLRFEFKYSPGAIAALIHDVTIIIGIFALTQTEFSLQIVAALLAVIGYSVNDTVIVYDRVREHEAKYAGRDLRTHINNAVNETLSRTILTSGTTLFISVTMFMAGGGAIKDFFFAISLGVLIGTYSSIFVAAPVTLFFDRLKAKQAA